VTIFSTLISSVHFLDYIIIHNLNYILYQIIYFSSNIKTKGLDISRLKNEN